MHLRSVVLSVRFSFNAKLPGPELLLDETETQFPFYTMWKDIVDVQMLRFWYREP